MGGRLASGDIGGRGVMALCQVIYPSRQLLPTIIPLLPPNVKERDEGFARITEIVTFGGSGGIIG